MTRRLVVTIVGVVAAALAVASIGTVVILRLQARTEARTELRDQAVRLASRVETVQAPGALQAVTRALRLEGADVLRLDDGGRLRGNAPPGVTLADLDPERLRAGRPVTGVGPGGVAFAAAPAERGASTLVVVLTRQVDTGSGVLGPWFLVAVVTTLALAAAVAGNLARRLTRPLREAQEATRRIASGDLAVRVPEDAGDGSELAGLAHSINVMAESLERSRGLERQFLLSVSHDLRTPLTSIRGFGEALAEGKAPDPAHAGSVITAEAGRLERLVGDLLELAQLDARRFSLDIRSTDVAEVVSDTIEGFRPAAERAAVTLTAHLGASGAGPATPAAADPDRLAQVVANLVENALKFATSRISVAVDHDEHDGDGGARVRITVVDDGPGIAPGDLAHVFEPFYQSGRAPARQVGSGLGLAIVAELVGAMGGSVRAEALAVGGTRMVVSLKEWRP
ncbi:MAG TPA: HAMP domain-containing sensor histidine kinase, partial [Acidimicrobiales bacterium]|nr:HAMP domain-containing sensor histidine kinase [Acidimicrobiales bacterium]